MHQKKTVWITRTLPGALETAKRVEAMGLTAIIAPLLDISLPDDLPTLPQKDTVLIFTSKNGVDAFSRYFPERAYKVITVGTESALHARAQGFTSVKSAYGTAESVSEIVLKTVPKSQAVLHCAGQHVRGRIVETLVGAGYSAQRALYYQSRPIDDMPDIDVKKISNVLLYSPLAAQTLAALIPDLSWCTLISISQNTQAGLGSIKARRSIVAEMPTENAVLACLSA